MINISIEITKRKESIKMEQYKYLEKGTEEFESELKKFGADNRDNYYALKNVKKVRLDVMKFLKNTPMDAVDEKRTLLEKDAGPEWFELLKEYEDDELKLAEILKAFDAGVNTSYLKTYIDENSDKYKEYREKYHEQDHKKEEDREQEEETTVPEEQKEKEEVAIQEKNSDSNFSGMINEFFGAVEPEKKGDDSLNKMMEYLTSAIQNDKEKDFQLKKFRSMVNAQEKYIKNMEEKFSAVMESNKQLTEQLAVVTNEMNKYKSNYEGITKKISEINSMGVPLIGATE